MTKRRYTRRSFLRGLGGVAVSLPLLSTGLPGIARAAGGASGQGTPKRFIFFIHPNGVVPDAWFPTPGSSESDFELGQRPPAAD